MSMYINKEEKEALANAICILEQEHIVDLWYVSMQGKDKLQDTINKLRDILSKTRCQ